MSVVFPKRLVSGDTWTIEIKINGYPSRDYSLCLSCKSVNGKLDDINAASSSASDSYIINVPSSVTASYGVGMYYYQMVCSDANGSKYTVATGSFNILPSYSTCADNLDPRSIWEKRLDILNRYIELRLNNVKDIDVKTIKIDGYELEKYSLNQLFDLAARFEARIRVSNSSSSFVKITRV
jgi:hypothetical protein